MLIRPHDALEDRTVATEFLTAQGFGHLAASGHDHDVPVVVPTQYVVDGDDIVLHLAAANPVLLAAGLVGVWALLQRRAAGRSPARAMVAG